MLARLRKLTLCHFFSLQRQWPRQLKATTPRPCRKTGLAIASPLESFHFLILPPPCRLLLATPWTSPRPTRRPPATPPRLPTTTTIPSQTAAPTIRLPRMAPRLLAPCLLLRPPLPAPPSSPRLSRRPSSTSSTSWLSLPSCCSRAHFANILQHARGLDDSTPHLLVRYRRKLRHVADRRLLQSSLVRAQRDAVRPPLWHLTDLSQPIFQAHQYLILRATIEHVRVSQRYDRIPQSSRPTQAS